MAEEEQIETVVPTDSLDALELVLRGRFQLQRRDERPIRHAIDMFNDGLRVAEVAISAQRACR